MPISRAQEALCFVVSPFSSAMQVEGGLKSCDLFCLQRDVGSGWPKNKTESIECSGWTKSWTTLFVG